MLIITLPTVTTNVTVADAHPDNTDTVLPTSEPNNTYTMLPASTLPNDEINATTRSPADIDVEHTTLANANNSKDYSESTSNKDDRDNTSKDNNNESITSNICEYLSNKNYLAGNFTNFEKNPTHSLITTSCVDISSKDNKLKAIPQIPVSISQTKKLHHWKFY
jgi:hypothetical protein